ncbi:ureide permease 3 isoform X4 [Prosopis cineraria]|uniref:ureide permease 3 isoform X4 n=1 Tax=Prosopis cineraria TaxID=364024 RepID=UPI0024104256|nr:ureide permease 3 isoform X4 [Prosopis cineraria]
MWFFHFPADSFAHPSILRQKHKINYTPGETHRERSYTDLKIFKRMCESPLHGKSQSHSSMPPLLQSQDFSDSFFLIASQSERVLSSGLEMYMVESKVGAILCMLLALFFLGTWPAIMTLLERRGRLPQHTYLDYSITNLLAAVLIAFTFGEMGKSTPDNPNFIDQLYQDNWPSVLFAMAGGVVLSIGNLSAQYAWALVGLSVVEVVSSSINVVIGTTLNYFLDDRINRAQILFPGVGCFLIAVCLGSAVHSSNIADDEAKLSNLSNNHKDGTILINTSSGKEINEESVVKSKDLESGGVGSADKAKAGTAAFLIELEKKRAIKIEVWSILENRGQVRRVLASRMSDWGWRRSSFLHHVIFPPYSVFVRGLCVLLLRGCILCCFMYSVNVMYLGKVLSLDWP